MPQWRFQSFPNGSVASGVTAYASLQSNFALNSTEANVSSKMYVAYTFSDIRVEVISIDGASSSFALRDDGVTSSNVIVAITASGWQEDITGSDAISADSLMNYLLSEDNAMHDDQVDIDHAMITYESSSDAPKIGSGFNTNILSSQFSSPGSDLGGTESRLDLLIKRAQTASNLTANVQVASGTWNLVMRINQADSSNLQITTLADGQNEDVTGSEAYADGDDLNFNFVEAVAGSLIPRVFFIDIDSGESWWGTFSEAFTTREYKAFNGTSGNTTADDNFFARIGSVSAGNLQTFVVTAGSGTRDVTLRVGSTDSTNLTIAITATGFAEDVTGSEAIADDDNVTASMASTSGAVTVSRVAVELPFSSAAAPENPDARGFIPRAMVY